MSVVTSPWFIGLIVAVVVVIIVIVIVVLLIRRSKGQKYHVHESERLKGTADEPDEEDVMAERPKSATVEDLGDTADLDTQPEGPAGTGDGESETDSMAEYGGMDPAKFNEDGSFIGQYGGMKTEYPPQAMSTFV